MSNQESIEARELRFNNLKQIGKLRSQISNNKSRILYAYEKLKPGQKKFLLIASGIKIIGSVSEYKPDVHDIQAIEVGLKKLKSLINEFKYTDEVIQ